MNPALGRHFPVPTGPPPPPPRVFAIANSFLVLLSVNISVCPTLWDPIDPSPPVSSVQGILQILEWVAVPSSRGSSQPRDRLLCLLHWQAGSSSLAPPGEPFSKCDERPLRVQDLSFLFQPHLHSTLPLTHPVLQVSTHLGAGPQILILSVRLYSWASGSNVCSSWTSFSLPATVSLVWSRPPRLIRILPVLPFLVPCPHLSGSRYYRGPHVQASNRVPPSRCELPGQ